MVQRLCGICPVSHHLAAAKAIDQIVGLEPEDLSVPTQKIQETAAFRTDLSVACARIFSTWPHRTCCLDMMQHRRTRNVVEVSMRYP